MKKRLLIFAMGSLCLALAGCGGSSNDGASENNSASSEVVSEADSSETESETTTEASEESTEKKGLSSVDTSALTEKLPDMVNAFKSDVEAIIVGDDHVMYSVEPVTFDEADAYVAACKDAGYTYDTDQGSDESGFNYWAYDESKTYYLEVFYSSEDNDIDIYLTDKSKYQQ